MYHERADKYKQINKSLSKVCMFIMSGLMIFGPKSVSADVTYLTTIEPGSKIKNKTSRGDVHIYNNTSGFVSVEQYSSKSCNGEDGESLDITVNDLYRSGEYIVFMLPLSGSISVGHPEMPLSSRIGSNNQAIKHINHRLAFVIPDKNKYICVDIDKTNENKEVEERS